MVGGGELCNEGMLRKLGPTVSLTTYFPRILNLLSLLIYVIFVDDMHIGTCHHSKTELWVCRSRKSFLHLSAI